MALRYALLLALAAAVSSASAQAPAFVSANGPFSSGVLIGLHPSGALLVLDGGRVFQSYDRGRSWAPVGAARPYPRDVHILPDGTLLAIQGGSVRRSADLGATWQTPGQERTGVDRLALGPGGSPWYAFGLFHVYRSNDAAATWTELPLDTPIGTIQAATVGPGGEVLVVRYYSGTVGTHRLRRSLDGGVTWATVPTPNGHLDAIGRFDRGREGAVYAISYSFSGMAFDNRDAALHRSTDGGASWTRVLHGDVAGVLDRADGTRVSNCAESQGLAISFGSHGRPSRDIALSTTSSLRITATSATFFGFPRPTRSL